MDHVEIPFEPNKLKFIVSLFSPISIVLGIYLILYYITHNFITFNPYYFLFIICLFIISLFFSIKSILFFIKKPPSIIFDKDKITSSSILGKYSLDVSLFDNYSFTEVNGIPYVYIHSINYKKFKKQLQLGLHPYRRFSYSCIKSTGHKGLLISTFTLSTNYEQAIDFLNHHFEYKS